MFSACHQHVRKLIFAVTTAALLSAPLGATLAGTILNDPLPYKSSKTGLSARYDQAEYALGSYTVNVVFVQDADDFWDTSLIEDRKAAFRSARNFWELQTAALHPNARLTLNLNFVNGGQPIEVPNVGGGYGKTDQLDYILPAMASFGFTASSSESAVTRDFNHASRTSTYINDRGDTVTGTNWAFTTYVLPIKSRANAYLNGPWAELYREANDKVIAHEWGHIFGAGDEYSSSDAETSDKYGYLNVENGNAYWIDEPAKITNPNFVSKSLMNNNSLTLNPYTIGQVGILDSDGDGVPDILDTQPTLKFVEHRDQQDQFGLTGSALVGMVLKKNYSYGITIDTIADASYRLNGGDWLSWLPTDGAFGGYSEDMALWLTGLHTGDYTLDVRVFNSMDNFSEKSFQFVIVPEPASALVLVVGVMGLLLRRRR